MQPSSIHLPGNSVVLCISEIVTKAMSILSIIDDAFIKIVDLSPNVKTISADLANTLSKATQVCNLVKSFQPNHPIKSKDYESLLMAEYDITRGLRSIKEKAQSLLNESTNQQLNDGVAFIINLECDNKILSLIHLKTTFQEIREKIRSAREDFKDEVTLFHYDSVRSAIIESGNRTIDAIKLLHKTLILLTNEVKALTNKTTVIENAENLFINTETPKFNKVRSISQDESASKI
jgi:hypothetical protein